MQGRESQSPASVDNIFTQAYGYFGHTVLGLFVAEGIVVERPSYAGERREVVAAVVFGDNFLYDHSHLLLVDDVAGSGHVDFARGVEHRCVDAFYGIVQPLHAAVAVGGVGHHVGGVYSGEWLVVRVFEQTRTAHCKRPVDHIEERGEVVGESFGQFCRQKSLEDIFVGRVAECERIELVHRHEFIEYIGAQHHCAWYRYGESVEIIAYRVFLDN